jgi:hypothetical protein
VCLHFGGQGKVELSSIRFALGVTEETIVEWLRRAAEKAAEITEHWLRELPVTQVQLDELWNFIFICHPSYFYRHHRQNAYTAIHPFFPITFQPAMAVSATPDDEKYFHGKPGV